MRVGGIIYGIREKRRHGFAIGKLACEVCAALSSRLRDRGRGCLVKDWVCGRPVIRSYGILSIPRDTMILLRWRICWLWHHRTMTVPVTMTR